jgi:hypothetical protein
VSSSETTGVNIPAPSEQVKSTWDKFLTEINESYINNLKRYTPMNEFTLDINGTTKTYKRNKIKGRQFAELERLRSRLAAEKDLEKASDIQTEIYVKHFEYYLGGTLDEYNDADYEELKKILDACNFRTQHGYVSKN